MTAKGAVVTFFPATAPTATGSCGPGAETSCCGTAMASPDAASDTIESLAERVNRHYAGKVDVQIASYHSEADINAAISRLNTILLASGKAFRVTSVNFYTFVESLGPLVAVGDQILCTRRLPAWGELSEAVEKVAITV